MAPALPDSVLQQVQQAVVELPETGLSVLGMSHRSSWFVDLLAQTEADLRALLQVPDDYSVAFLQGGSSLQFSMIPMNFSVPGAAAAEYVTTGYWSRKALEEASRVGPMRLIWDGAASGDRTLPSPDALDWDTRASFRHYVSNETVEGLQFPVVADLSAEYIRINADYST